MSSPDTRNCTGKPTGGPFSSRETRPRSSGKSVVEQREQARRARVSRSSLLFATSTNWAKFDCVQLLVERQVEARAAAADVRDVALDAAAPRRGSPRASSLPPASRRTSCLRAAAGRPAARRATTRGRTAAARSGTARARRRRARASRPSTVSRCADAPRDRRAQARRRTACRRRRRDPVRATCTGGGGLPVTRAHSRARSDGARGPSMRSGSIL